MQVEVVTPVESVSADVALEWLHLRMNYHMFIQFPTLPEHFPTGVTFKSLLNRVGFHVKFVVFEVGHHFTTSVTLEWILLFLGIIIGGVPVTLTRGKVCTFI